MAASSSSPVTSITAGGSDGGRTVGCGAGLGSPLTQRPRTSSHLYPAVHPSPSGCTNKGSSETTVPTCQNEPASRFYSTRS